LSGTQGVGKLYLVDTSAAARAEHPAVQAVIAGLIVDRAAATCLTLDLRAGYSGRNQSDLKAIADRRKSQYIALPITELVAQRARDVQLRMAARGKHRSAQALNVITAAVAQDTGLSSARRATKERVRSTRGCTQFA
jgi:hypothetical protein